MIRNYLKIAFRTLWNNKLFSFVNIFGLALSMSVGIKLIANIKNNFDTKEFVKYLAWAGALGLPVGWFLGKLLHDRLGNAVDFGAKNLTIGFAVVVVVGLLTTLSQTLRAGRNNPSNILRGQ